MTSYTKHNVVAFVVSLLIGTAGAGAEIESGKTVWAQEGAKSQAAAERLVRLVKRVEPAEYAFLCALEATRREVFDVKRAWSLRSRSMLWDRSFVQTAEQSLAPQYPEGVRQSLWRIARQVDEMERAFEAKYDPLWQEIYGLWVRQRAVESGEVANQDVVRLLGPPASMATVWHLEVRLDMLLNEHFKGLWKIWHEMRHFRNVLDLESNSSS